MSTERTSSDPVSCGDPKKKLRVNSILDPCLRKIRKPCEARAGGCTAIVMAVSLTILAVLIGMAVLFFRRSCAGS